MSDLSVRFDEEQALQGVSQGNVEELKALHDPGREGIPEAMAAHAHATTAEEDPPVQLMGTHAHHHYHHHPARKE